MRFSSWSLGRKLGAGFGLTVAIFLIALGIGLIYSASAQSRWRNTLHWDTAVKGIAMQIRSTQIRMAEQSLLVATWDPKHMQAWEDGVTLGDQGAKDGGDRARPRHQPHLGRGQPPPTIATTTPCTTCYSRPSRPATMPPPSRP